ncbi:MAG: hypothetical protein BWY89_00744 [Bacteroidetes bacterium ADurb.BinA012]|nr:MAG: hypothetical protein BWY89_00744 [Bacteroidetes bacterium ADurb.BinA012]
MPPVSVKPHLGVRYLQGRIENSVRTLVLDYLHNPALLKQYLNGGATRPVDTNKLLSINYIVNSLTIPGDLYPGQLVISEIA